MTVVKSIRSSLISFRNLERNYLYLLLYLVWFFVKLHYFDKLLIGFQKKIEKE